MNQLPKHFSKRAIVFCVSLFALPFCVIAQVPAEKPQEKPAEKSTQKTEEPPNAAQIELLETKYRFETSGDSRKEVHAVVKINSELGVRQFARLNFDYNRRFQSVDIPLARITHANGGTSDILPSAITDVPNPAVEKFPAYQDVRVKSVRILGLQPGDSLEYRVITTTTKPPLAPEFWLEHSFDRTGVVSEEHFQVVLPASILAASPLIVVKNENVRQKLEYRLNSPSGCGACEPPNPGAKIDPSLVNRLPLLSPGQKQKQDSTQRDKSTEVPSSPLPDEPLPIAENGKVQILVKPSASDTSIEASQEAGNALVSYTWRRMPGSQESERGKVSPPLENLPDIALGKISTWDSLSYQLYAAFSLPASLPGEVVKLSREIIGESKTPGDKAKRIYDFVSQKIKTVDLPLGTTGFSLRRPEEIASSGYGTPEDKFFLFRALAKAADIQASAALVPASKKIEALVVSTGVFSHLVTGVVGRWCDPSLEVAPFGFLPASYRGSTALQLGVDTGYLVDVPSASMTFQIPKELPFASSQRVTVGATLLANGTLTTKVQYSLRGDNELLLRVAFHKTPTDKQQEIAQYLALSDGFRGKVTSVKTSDPYDTDKSFEVEYELTQEKFVDWSKKPVRVPALLPLPGLPDVTRKPAANSKLELGTPLDITLTGTLRLPPGTIATAPAGTSVKRDYATFTSTYSSKANILSFSRHLNFLLPEIPGDRMIDLNAFIHAVQSDQSQLFVLDKPESVPSAKPK
jgi:hypothetical protein